MRRFIIPLLLCSPLITFADTDEVDVDEEPIKYPPSRRSLAPKPKVFVVDRNEIHIETIFEYAVSHIVIKDGAASVIYDSSGYDCYYLPFSFTEGETYNITLYLDDRCFSGSYLP